MTAAVIPIRRCHVTVQVPQAGIGPAFTVGDTPGGAWAGRPGLCTSHIPAANVPEVVRGLLQAVEHDPDADHAVVADLLDVLRLHGYLSPDGDPDSVA